MNPVLTYIKNLAPKGEPAVVVSWTVGVLTAIVGELTTHHIIPVTIQASQTTKDALPIAALFIVGAVGHFIRPLVSPTSKLPQPLEGVLSSVEGVIDGSDGLPTPNDNTLVSDVHQPNAAASTMLAQQASDGSAASVAAGLPVVAPPVVATPDIPVAEST